MVAVTFLSDKPASLPSYFLSKIGTRDGFGGIMLCPKLLQKAYPSPVEPVDLYEVPPVAMTKASHVIWPLLVTNLKLPSFCLFIDLT